MDLSTKSATTLLVFALVLSTLLSISTSQDIDLAPSPSSSSTSPPADSSDSSSAAASSPSPSGGDASSSSSGPTPADMSPPSDGTTDTTSAGPATDPASSTSAAPAPSPDASFPSFPTMFSQKFERKMQEKSSMTKATDMVRELCSGAENPGKCMEFFRESRSDDPAEIITTEIGTLKTLVREGISAATKVRQSSGNSAAASGVLDVCLENYDKAMGNLDKASATCARCIRSSPKCSPRDTGEVRTMLSAAISNVGFCDEAFNAQGLTPPMKATNEAVIELSDWLLEFCKKLGQKY